MTCVTQPYEQTKYLRAMALLELDIITREPYQGDRSIGTHGRYELIQAVARFGVGAASPALKRSPILNTQNVIRGPGSSISRPMYGSSALSRKTTAVASFLSCPIVGWWRLCR